MPTVRLFVGNLDYGVTEEELREIFGTVGRPTTIKIMVNEGGPRGFAFVRLDTMDAPIDCWREPLQGHRLHGRPMHIEIAIPMERIKGPINGKN